jgi:phosphoglycerol transferase
LWYGLLVVLLVAGFLDQTTVRFVPDYPELAARDRSDSEFIGWIQASLPRDAAVFELPWGVFPEGHMTERMLMYDPLDGYLHSSSLRWSFGAMRGRANAQWQERLAAQITAAGAHATYSPKSAQAARALLEGPLRILVLAGFDGLYIDRYGYADDANPLIAALAQTLGTAPLMSPDLRLAFFNLTEFAHSFTDGIDADQLKRMRAAAIPRCDAIVADSS